MPEVPPIQGVVAYDFREAINKLACSSADAATLAARWYDLCNTEQAMDVTIGLSNGESKTVPNLAKALQAIRERKGEIDASIVRVRQSGTVPFGADVKPQGVDVGTASAKYADGSTRSQHCYVTPYNVFHDVCYLSDSPSCYDSFAFFDIPCMLWFNAESSLNDANAHAIAIKPLTDTAPLVVNRDDRRGTWLSTQLTLINGDPVRTGTFFITNDTAGGNVVQTVVLMPGQHATFVIWCKRGADTCNIIKL